MVGFVHINCALEQVDIANKVGNKAAIRRFINLGRLPNLQNFPFVHNAYARGHRHGLFLVVRDHDAGDADLFNDVHQFKLGSLAQLRIQGSEWFIQQQQLRPLGQTARQRHPLLLTTRQLVRFALRIRFELYQCQHLINAQLDFGFRQTIPAQTKRNVVPDTEMGKQRVTLEHHVDRALVRREPGNVHPGQHDLPGSGHLKPRQHAQQRGLAAARGAQQGKNFALLDIQGNIVHGKHIIELFDNAFDLQKRGCLRLPASYHRLAHHAVSHRTAQFILLKIDITY